MKIMNIVLVIAAAVAVFAGYLVWMNRASEKIMTAVIPITVAALVGIFLSIYVFGGEPAITVAFHSTFQYDAATKLPISDPALLHVQPGVPAPNTQLFIDRRFIPAFFGPSNLRKIHPEYFDDPNDGRGILLYHQLLQRAILDWISMHYRPTWQT